ncbi:MAG: hypothetical protein AAGI48_09460 [Verrucomicrobiota bacterium]
MKRFLFRTLLLILALLAGLGWYFRAEILEAWRSMGKPLLVIGKRSPQPDPERYEVLKEDVERWRQDLAKRYRKARTAAERELILDEARVFLESAVPDLMSCWLGTPWDFNGTSETPGEGKVACGYFVATVLRDAGFKLDRYKLARQPSENIILSFVPRRELVKRVGVPYDSYAAEVRGYPSGIRIVGLDTHVGFLVSGADGFRFVHSSGSRPWCVVDEAEQDAEVLKKSNYRVHASLTGNRDVIRRWLAGERIRVNTGG